MLSSKTDIENAAKLFGSTEHPRLLEGGQGQTYRAGSIILKPSEGASIDTWIAEVFSVLEDTGKVRISKPIRSINNHWTEEGYTAWSYVEGSHEKQNCQEALDANSEYHSLLKHAQKPPFWEDTKDPWSVAEKVALQDEQPQYDAEFMQILNPLFEKLRPVKMEEQVIHGDMLGNLLFAENLPPAVIDVTPRWGPVEFSKAVMLVDAVALFGHGAECVQAFQTSESPDLLQFTLRAAIRRIVEQSEQVLQYDKNKTEALSIAEDYGEATNFIANILKQ